MAPLRERYVPPYISRATRSLTPGPTAANDMSIERSNSLLPGQTRRRVPAGYVPTYRMPAYARPVTRYQTQIYETERYVPPTSSEESSAGSSESESESGFGVDVQIIDLTDSSEESAQSSGQEETDSENERTDYLQNKAKSSIGFLMNREVTPVGRSEIDYNMQQTEPSEKISRTAISFLLNRQLTPELQDSMQDPQRENTIAQTNSSQNEQTTINFLLNSKITPMDGSESDSDTEDIPLMELRQRSQTSSPNTDVDPDIIEDPYIAPTTDGMSELDIASEKIRVLQHIRHHSTEELRKAKCTIRNLRRAHDKRGRQLSDTEAAKVKLAERLVAERLHKALLRKKVEILRARRADRQSRLLDNLEGKLEADLAAARQDIERLREKEQVLTNSSTLAWDGMRELEKTVAECRRDSAILEEELAVLRSRERAGQRSLREARNSITSLKAEVTRLRRMSGIPEDMDICPAIHCMLEVEEGEKLGISSNASLWRNKKVQLPNSLRRTSRNERPETEDQHQGIQEWPHNEKATPLLESTAGIRDASTPRRRIPCASQPPTPRVPIWARRPEKREKTALPAEPYVPPDIPASRGSEPLQEDQSAYPPPHESTNNQPRIDLPPPNPRIPAFSGDGPELHRAKRDLGRQVRIACALKAQLDIALRVNSALEEAGKTRECKLFEKEGENRRLGAALYEEKTYGNMLNEELLVLKARGTDMEPKQLYELRTTWGRELWAARMEIAKLENRIVEHVENNARLSRHKQKLQDRIDYQAQEILVMKEQLAREMDENSSLRDQLARLTPPRELPALVSK
ncbi:hypothetical protein BDV18DRAFT_158226 [Aspergillus unguis]